MRVVGRHAKHLDNAYSLTVYQVEGGGAMIDEREILRQNLKNKWPSKDLQIGEAYF